MAILTEHRLTDRHRRRARGWMFPSKHWRTAVPVLAAQGVGDLSASRQFEDRFTVHGLRRTFVDLARRARVDGV